MLVRRYWIVTKRGRGLFEDPREIKRSAEFVGWFLFGFIPLYIKQITYWS